MAVLTLHCGTRQVIIHCNSILLNPKREEKFVDFRSETKEYIVIFIGFFI